MVVYLFVTLVLFFLFFAAIQNGLIGKRGVKGLVFGSMFGVLWALGFLLSVVFFDTFVTTLLTCPATSKAERPLLAVLGQSRAPSQAR